MQENEVATQRGVEELITLFEAACKEFGGEVLEVRGDGIFALFKSAVNSVLFASTTQERIAAHNEKYTDNRKIRFRIGIHLGDVLWDEKVYYGDSVNIAARIEGLAEPGGICISSSVYQQVKNTGQLGYENLGLKQLKNIKEFMEIFRVTSDTNTAMRVSSPRKQLIAKPQTEAEGLEVRPSVAVLPFKNTYGGADFDYFSDGVTEDIITNLSKFHNLFVISRGSSFMYKDRNLPAKQIGQELGVRYVADGSVRTAGNRIRISVQLVDTEKDQTVWTERYDRSLDDIFEVQDEISAIICNATSVIISGEESLRLARLLPSNLEAYDNLLKGQQHVFRYTRDDMRQARVLYEAAASIDPRYGRALAAIAQTLNFEWLFSWADESEETLDYALSIAHEAVSLDQGDARGYAGVGFVSLYQKKHDASIRAYERALQLNPNDADVISELADTYAHSGRSEEAVTLLKKAMHLNPFYPDEYLWNLGGAYYNLKQYENAIDAVNQMNNPTEGSRILAASHAQLGQLDIARAHAKKTLQAHPDFSLAKWQAMMPDKFEEDSMAFAEGLRKAGLT
ncbi:MAG: adenylate/guanylate cyclase domain-containing protein [Gammaproteobacteria bacterium]|nr:adenylate/guanylate cyclase domain-containing protein [Gammaproteobacteria bacterium]